MSGSDYIKNTDPMPLWMDDLTILTTSDLERIMQAAQAELDKRCNVDRRAAVDTAARTGFINRLGGKVE